VSGEIWRDVPSVPGILVRSEVRFMYAPHREPMPNGGTRPYGDQPTFGLWAKDEGRFVTRFRGNIYRVHRLIAEAFLGPPPFEGAVAMHFDENAAKNRSSNLLWGTQKENLSADGFLPYCRNRAKEKSPTTKVRRKAAEPEP
jgi:HNH endonuclease